VRSSHAEARKKRDKGAAQKEENLVGRKTPDVGKRVLAKKLFVGQNS